MIMYGIMFQGRFGYTFAFTKRTRVRLGGSNTN
jgi:hypothetical protein